MIVESYFPTQALRRLGGGRPKGSFVVSSSFRKSLRTRCQLTGESRNQLLNPRGGMPFIDRQASIPAAVGDQAVLESLMMASLQRFHASPAVSPLGVSRIRVPALGSPTIHLDERVDVLSWCREILPVICEGEINGVPRLRVNKVAGPDLILEMDGTLARLAVHAAGVRWREVLHQRQEELEPFDLRLLWDSGRSTEEELQICQWHRPVAWLGSSLFRRSAAFQQTGGPCEFDAWLRGDRWVLELTAAPLTGQHPRASRHDEFLKLLLDGHLGLPLRIEHKTCICSDQFNGGSICFFHLVPRDEESLGRVQLRFCWDGDDWARKSSDSIAPQP